MRDGKWNVRRKMLMCVKNAYFAKVPNEFCRPVSEIRIFYISFCVVYQWKPPFVLITSSIVRVFVSIFSIGHAVFKQCRLIIGMLARYSHVASH